MTQTACGSYSWNGKVYTQSGKYEYKTKNAKGCDSTATMFLTITSPSVSSISHTACVSYTWNGKTYTESGKYEYKSTGKNGCDSIVTLDLTINTPTTSSMTQTACGSYSWNGKVYTQSGKYEHKTKNENGCDSTATLNLTINTIPSVTTSLQNGLLVASVTNATYQWLNCDVTNTAVANATNQVFLPTQTGNYAVKVSTQGCEVTSACVMYETQTTGLVDANQVVFSIYPNPNQGVFHIAGLPTGTYKILNLMGAVVFDFTVDNSDVQLLNLSHLAKGVYQVASGNTKIMHNKVVITD